MFQVHVFAGILNGSEVHLKIVEDRGHGPSGKSGIREECSHLSVEER